MKSFSQLLVALTFFACQGQNKETISISSMVTISGEKSKAITLRTNLSSIPIGRDAKLVEIIVPSKPSSGMLYADSLISGYRFIKLETNQECIIGETTNLRVDSTNIFVQDRNNNILLRFDIQGKFLCQIGSRGRGAKEYTEVRDFALDKQNKEVCVHDWNGKKLEYYNYDGEYLRTKPMYYDFNDMEFCNNNIIAVTIKNHQPKISSISNYQVTVCDLNFEPQYGAISNNPNPYKQQKFSFIPTFPLKMYEDGIYYSNVLSDTIWQIDNEAYHAAFLLNYANGGIKFTQDELGKMTDKLYELKRESCSSNHNKYIITPDFFYSMIHHDNISTPLFYCRKTGNVIFYDCINERRPIRSIGDILVTLGEFDYSFIGNSLVSIIQPYNLVSICNGNFFDKLPKQDQEFLKSINEEDNPILLISYLKEF